MKGVSSCLHRCHGNFTINRNHDSVQVARKILMIHVSSPARVNESVNSKNTHSTDVFQFSLMASVTS